MVKHETLCSIRNLVNYLYNTEEKHYAECNDKGKKCHIFRDVLSVIEWLDSNPDLPRVKCPRCGNMTLVIYGEGITSDNRHYPVEHCNTCDYPDLPCLISKEMEVDKMNELTRIAIRIKDEEAINCIDSGVPELVEWGKRRLSISWTKKEKT